MSTEDRAANKAREIEGTVVDGDPASELASDFSETARILFAAGSVTDTLAQVVELAVTTIEGCDYGRIRAVLSAGHGHERANGEKA